MPTQPNQASFKSSKSSIQEEPFQPFIPASAKIPEFTWKSFLVGVFFIIFFGASSVYLALCVGLTVGGSIPISAMLIGPLRRLLRSTVLENNLIQTIGSAGESIATVTVYTVPAFILFQGGERYFHYPQLITLAAAGGLLGILFMIPLRRSLIVREHKTLHYPEGSACAEVLIAGEKQGGSASPVFVGSLIAAIYWLMMKLLGLWKEMPYLIHRAAQGVYPNATLTLSATPEYLGIGYIIGPRTSTQMMAGALLAWLVLVPLFSVFPSLGALLRAKDVVTTLQDLGVSAALQGPPSASQIHTAYIKYIAVGAVIGAGIIALLKTVPIIIGSFRTVVDSLKNRGNVSQARTAKDLPMWLVLPGALVLVILIALLPHLPGKFPGSLLSSLLIVIFGFFFVTVSSRFVGVAGYTIEPITPMTFTTVMATAVLLLLLGWTSVPYQLAVIPIAAVVCIAAGNAGATSQDLKTGYLLGATPYKQQLGLILGVLISAAVVAGTILLVDRSIPQVTHAIGYVAPGQEGPKFGAPQATLLAMLIKSMLGGKMSWGLVLVGVGLSVVLELCGAMALSVAIGLYLPVSMTTAIFLGSLLRWFVKRQQRKSLSAVENELSKGMLFATGLVAGGAFAGMIFGFFSGFFPSTAKLLDLGHEYWKNLGTWGDLISIGMFLCLGVALYRYARKDLPPR